MNRQIFSIIVSAVIILITIFFAYKTYHNSISYEKYSLDKVQENKVENKIDNYFKKLLSISKVEKKDTTIRYKDNMNFYRNLFFLAVACLFFTYFISSTEIFVISIITVALISWIVGVFAPIMSIEIFKELPIFGYTVFKYDSKSIYSSVQKLWQIQNYFIAMLVALFSIVIPLLKTLSLYISTIKKVDIKYIDFIGKWSMADVFIISLILANLSLSADEFTDAKVGVAIYFFTIYVLLSILASYIIRKKII